MNYKLAFRNLMRPCKAHYAAVINLRFGAAVGLGGAEVETSDVFLGGSDSPIDRNSLPKLEQQLAAFGGGTSGGLSLEPTLYNDQLSRYLMHLNELRRINEGDDTSDSPGYSLNLVRVPVSVLPGKHTMTGYGAEVTISADLRLTDDLLPNTFRDLLINDVIDQLALPITKLVNDEKNLAKLGEFIHDYDLVRRGREQLERYVYELDILVSEQESGLSTYSPETEARIVKIEERMRALIEQIANDHKKVIGEEEHEKLFRDILKDNGHDGRYFDNLDLRGVLALEGVADAFIRSNSGVRQLYEKYQELEKEFSKVIDQAADINHVMLRKSPLAYPKHHLIDIFGDSMHTIGHVALDASKAIPKRGPYKMVQLPDVESFLRSEIETAYRFLKTNRGQMLWEFANQDLVESIRHRHRQPAKFEGDRYRFTLDDEISEHRVPPGVRSTIDLRNDFFQTIVIHHPRVAHSTTATLVWGILVEAALLNDRLVTDIQEVTKARECNGTCLATAGVWMEFFRPDPGPEACEVFNDYVRCRWPIHVFAIDPAAQDQNVADSLSRRREMQLAIAASVAEGSTSPNAAARMMRRVEADFDTIALNRTAIGFTHANDTFGWRFYPRFQSPPVPGALGAMHESFFGNDRARDVRRRQIEPGIRECMAMVIMPSFVRYVDLHTRSGWFALNNPRHKELTVGEGVELGQRFEAVKCTANRVCNANCYRAVDVKSLTHTIEQFERRLPNQEMIVEIPYENTLGGFELFNNGVTDLAPEVRGFYGSPEVVLKDPADDCKCKKDDGVALSNSAGDQCVGTCCGTTLFVVGDRFSVHDTRVVAGGQCVPFMLLSRQIMRVTIPSTVRTEKGQDGNDYVDLHVATPYGVSGHLEIPARKDEPAKPAATPAAKPKSGIAFEKGTLKVTLDIPKDLAVHPVVVEDANQKFKLKYSDAQIARNVLQNPRQLDLVVAVFQDGKIVPSTSYSTVGSVNLITQTEVEFSGTMLRGFVETTNFFQTVNVGMFKDKETIKRQLRFFAVPSGENALPFALDEGLDLEVRLHRTACCVETGKTVAATP